MKIINRRILIFSWIAGSLILALWIRYLLMPWVSWDMKYDFFKSYDFIREFGFAAFKDPISVYTPPYYYLLALASRLPIYKLYSIKLISVFFDFFAAYIIYRLISLKYRKDKLIPCFGSLAFLCLPTVFINSSMWGQFDIVHTTFILIAIYFSLIARCRRDLAMMLFFFGVAASVKGISLFVLPWILLVMYIRKAPVTFLILIPMAYLALIMPACIAGRGFWDLLKLPFYQAAAEKAFTANAPTIFQLLPHVEILKSAAVLFTFSIIFIFFVFLAMRSSAQPKEIILKSCLFCSIFVPFFLPKIHDRYFFMADVLSFIYAFYFPRSFYIAIGVQFVSFFSYLLFLFNVIIIPFPILSLILLAIIIFLFIDLMKSAAIGNEELLEQAAT